MSIEKKNKNANKSPYAQNRKVKEIGKIKKMEKISKRKIMKKSKNKLFNIIYLHQKIMRRKEKKINKNYYKIKKEKELILNLQIKP